MKLFLALCAKNDQAGDDHDHVAVRPVDVLQEPATSVVAAVILLPEHEGHFLVFQPRERQLAGGTDVR
jgi:hypothetical protein